MYLFYLFFYSCSPVCMLHFCCNLRGCHSVKIRFHACVLIVIAFLKICDVLSNDECR